MDKNSKTNTESYVVTARKWRPMVFGDVVGQAHVTTTLRNAIAGNRLSHAYIFSGPRGVGKTTTARILAKAINCSHPAKDNNPDNECELCIEITEGRSVNVFEIDGASNRGIDEIRNLREAVRYGPAKGKYKVYIIDEVHMLTTEAFNALLKTLEEPPSYILFIFATTEVHKVPATILSRCQRFDFRRNTIEEITGRLAFIAKKENLDISDDALLLLAKKADGSMRDGQSIFDQIVAFCGNSIEAKQIRDALNIVDQELFFRVTDYMKAKDAKGMLALVEEIVGQGVDLREFLQGLNEHLRNLLVTNISGSAKLVETSEIYKAKYSADAPSFPENRLLRCMQLVNDTDIALKYDPHPRFKLEISLLLLLKMEDSMNLVELLARLEDLKKKLDAAPTTPTPPAQPAKPVESRTSVRGSVKATQPLLRPEQVVPPTGASFEPGARYVLRKEIGGGSAPPSAIQKEVVPPVANISIDHIRDRWSLFLDGASKHKIALGTMLSESSPAGMNAGRLLISCPDDFHLDSLKRHKEYLVELAQSVFGGRLRIELEKSALPSTTNEIEKQDSRKTPETHHPVIQALVREVGARQIDP